MSPIILNKEELASPLWQKISKHLNSELMKLRESNDNKNISERDTQFNRGQIAAIKTILK